MAADGSFARGTWIFVSSRLWRTGNICWSCGHDRGHTWLGPAHCVTFRRIGARRWASARMAVLRRSLPTSAYQDLRPGRFRPCRANVRRRVGGTSNEQPGPERRVGRECATGRRRLHEPVPPQPPRQFDRRWIDAGMIPWPRRKRRRVGSPVARSTGSLAGQKRGRPGRPPGSTIGRTAPICGTNGIKSWVFAAERHPASGMTL